MEKTIRCVLCGKEFTDDEIIEGTSKCPNCGTKSLPCLIADDVNIKINWHELRILVIWAENWARHCDNGENPPEEKMLLSIMTIAQRLQKQFPDKVKLTLFGEIRDLRKDFDIETDIDNDKLLGL
jgi:predicted  nucleic acid-binding Zn-ribbon protein